MVIVFMFLCLLLSMLPQCGPQAVDNDLVHDMSTVYIIFRALPRSHCHVPLSLSTPYTVCVWGGIAIQSYNTQ